MSLFTIDFDRRIESTLPASELWRLMKEAFENPAQSSIWPVELEEVEPVELKRHAQVKATYKFGPIRMSPTYHITHVHQERNFSYESDRSHPLAGGATVEVEAHGSGSTLRWHGAYRPRIHPFALGAMLFVRLYFLRTFFTHLQRNIRHYEDSYTQPTYDAPRAQ